MGSPNLACSQSQSITVIQPIMADSIGEDPGLGTLVLCICLMAVLLSCLLSSSQSWIVFHASAFGSFIPRIYKLLRPYIRLLLKPVYTTLGSAYDTVVCPCWGLDYGDWFNPYVCPIPLDGKNSSLAVSKMECGMVPP